MVSGLWGKKIGMTQAFSAENTVIPVTVIDVGGWYVTNIRTKERDGYTAIQVGRVKKRYAQSPFSIEWLKKPEKYFGLRREIRVNAETIEALPTIGDAFDFGSVLQKGLSVDVFGTSTGRGFQGVIKRHGFNGPPGSHGSTMGRRPGSIGFMRSRGRVIKGKRLPGHMGNDSCAVMNLEVVSIDNDAKIVMVKGAVPGRSGSFVFIRKEII